MADKLGIGTEIKELRLGSSFTNSRGSAFHTFRYDFKPASVDTSKMATVDILPNNEVNVTVPHCDGAGTAQTSVFRGPKKSYAKECVLIIDHNTGEIVLERLSHNIQLKKTRSEGTGRPGRSSSPDGTPHGFTQSHNCAQPLKKPSPIQKSPPSSYSSSTPSPPYSSPHQTMKASPKHGYGLSGLASRKAIASPHQLHHNHNSQIPVSSHPGSMPMLDDLGAASSHVQEDDTVGVLSDSSSDSGSDSSSDSSLSDSDSDVDQIAIPASAGGRGSATGSLKDSAPTSQKPSAPLSMPSHLLSEDLRLSDSGSDSD